MSARCVTAPEPCSDAGAELEGESSTMAKTTKKTTKADTPEKAPKAEKAVSAAKAKPAGKNPFPKKFIEQQKALLVAERARYIKSADALKVVGSLRGGK